jgi:hypothetical protein
VIMSIQKGIHTMSSVKEEAKRVREKLPELTRWDDTLYEFYVKKKMDMV